MTVWVEVADLFDYAAAHARPTGIQRMALEIAFALRDGSADVRAMRCDPKGEGYLAVEWRELADLFAAPGAAGAARIITGAGPVPAERDAVRAWLAEVLPPTFRLALGRAVRGQIGVVRSLIEAVGALLQALRRKGPVRGAPVRPARGDVLLCLGSPWNSADYAERLAALRAEGVGIAAFLHDMIPLRRPEWCHPGTRRDFLRWFAACAPLCDHIFVASEATAADVRLGAARLGVALRAEPVKLPIGTGFGAAAPAAGMAHLPAPGSYVLFVSTIEPRKNHALAIRAWQRLIETRGAAAVPKLVFAGRPGWMVADLLEQLENAAHLDGQVIRVEGASDAELAALYAGCLFTIYPSLYEGWGLPVVESLGFGKPCLAADATSLPEAGGNLARYFDPDNLHDAVRAIGAVLDDPAELAAWTAQVRTEFRSVPWSDTAAAIIAHLGEGASA